MKIDLCTLDWVAVSAIATAVMVIITGITLWQNRNQLEELKRQWREQNRSHLVFSVEVVHCFYCLKIHNTGTQMARNIEFDINTDFLDKVFIDSFRNTLSELGHCNLIIPGNESRLFIITYQHPQRKGSLEVDGKRYKNCEMIDKVRAIMDVKINISGKYNDGVINEMFTINQYIKGSLTKKDEVAAQLERFYDLYKYANNVNADYNETCCDCKDHAKCTFCNNQKTHNNTNI